MVKCKNIIFGKCKHLVVCRQCFRSGENPIEHCPFCREEIDDYVELKEYRG